jgi:hypothetical protein
MKLEPIRKGGCPSPARPRKTDESDFASKGAALFSDRHLVFYNRKGKFRNFRRRTLLAPRAYPRDDVRSHGRRSHRAFRPETFTVAPRSLPSGQQPGLCARRRPTGEGCPGVLPNF